MKTTKIPISEVNGNEQKDLEDLNWEELDYDIIEDPNSGYLVWIIWVVMVILQLRSELATDL